MGPDKGMYIGDMDPRIKISVNTDTSVIGFYRNIGNIGNIGKISMDIFTRILVRLKFFIFLLYR